ncbi:aspartate aminotransferase family protein [Nitriliruptor alkaliphilus]|uniref:aminotransferase family protein n=1 Tax=Nitriliruptor alkaliphilus TaxID=427918 RepID=UPI00069819FA|nr:aminotransferase class III-fold pyridoxal phosphate-dependent enzyme [Nitriliruptor alkaliphilus]
MAATAFLHPFTRPSADGFLTIMRGEGATVWDAHGRSYVDGMASLWYCNIGHGRGEIADAVATQMRQLAGYHTFERFTNEPTEQLCERLAARAPVAGSRVFLTSSGSEAVETAVKLARFSHHLAGDPARTVVISRRPSYHGVAYAGTTLTGLPLNQAGFGPLLPDVCQVPRGDLEAAAAAFAANPGRVAAVIAEPVIGAGGVYPPEPGELAGLRALCDQHGALLILDEVITGFGRLGHWWGADRYGVTPDLTVFAKAVTSGYQPLGGVLVTPRVLAPFAADPDAVLRTGHTYSGHPAASAAALVNLDVLEDEGLLDRAVHVGRRLADGLSRLIDGERIVEVRGDGAVRAVGLGPGVDAPQVREHMLAAGVIARPIGAGTIAFSPPLVITDAQVDRLVQSLADAVARPAVPVVTR